MSTGIGKPQKPLDQDACPSLNVPHAGEPAFDLTLRVSPEASCPWPNVAGLTSTGPWNCASFTPATARAWDQESGGLGWVTAPPYHWPWDLGQVTSPLGALPASPGKTRFRRLAPPSLQGLPGSEHSRPGPSSEHRLAPDEGSDWNWTHVCSVRDRAELGRRVPEAFLHCSDLWLQAALPWGPTRQPPSTSRAPWPREHSSSVANTSRQCIVKKSRKRYNNPRHSTSEP